MAATVISITISYCPLACWFGLPNHEPIDILLMSNVCMNSSTGMKTQSKHLPRSALILMMIKETSEASGGKLAGLILWPARQMYHKEILSPRTFRHHETTPTYLRCCQDDPCMPTQNLVRGNNIASNNSSRKKCLNTSSSLPLLDMSRSHLQEFSIV